MLLTRIIANTIFNSWADKNIFAFNRKINPNSAFLKSIKIWLIRLLILNFWISNKNLAATTYNTRLSKIVRYGCGLLPYPKPGQRACLKKGGVIR